MIETIRDEIRRTYPEVANTLLEEIERRRYTLHCSPAYKKAFVSYLKKEIINVAYVIDGVPKDYDIKVFTHPAIGTITIVVDRKRGHKITKDGVEK